MASFEHKLDAATPEAELLALVDRLNADPAVHGIPRAVATGRRSATRTR